MKINQYITVNGMLSKTLDMAEESKHGLTDPDTKAIGKMTKQI